MNNAEVLIKFKGDTKDVDTKTKKLGSDISSKLGSVAKGVGKAFAVASAAAVTQVWAYIGELVFNMLVLVGTIKASDRIVREMMGL